MLRIVFLDRATVPAVFEPFSFPHEFVVFDATAADETVVRLEAATIAITNKVVIGERELAQLPELKLIALAATGYNNIDVDAARRRGVRVVNVPAYASESVPEHVMMLVLMLRRNLLRYRADVASGAWSRANQFCLVDYEIFDVKNSTFGIVGYGALGRATAHLARSFGARVIIAERKDAKQIREGRTKFEDALQTCDVLSLHCPLTPQTRNLIGAEELKLMKPSAILINCARGGVVDESALIDALRDGEIMGAGVDVLTNEPPREGNVLLAEELPNLIVTPHNSWASHDGARALVRGIVGNIEAFVAGESLNVVA